MALRYHLINGMTALVNLQFVLATGFKKACYLRSDCCVEAWHCLDKLFAAVVGLTP